jgi:hypothetical protein
MASLCDSSQVLLFCNNVTFYAASAKPFIIFVFRVQLQSNIEVDRGRL